jgi:hypothetical protein
MVDVLEALCRVGSRRQVDVMVLIGRVGCLYKASKRAQPVHIYPEDGKLCLTKRWILSSFDAANPRKPNLCFDLHRQASVCVENRLTVLSKFLNKQFNFCL